PWFGCACCPPNLMRTLASLTGYFYATRSSGGRALAPAPRRADEAGASGASATGADMLYVNFFAASTGEATVAGTAVKLTQTTDYPWQGAVRLAVAPERPARFTVCVRIPEWARNRPVPGDLYRYDDASVAAWSARVDGAEVNAPLEQGYLAITREWRDGDEIELDFAEPVRTVRGDERIAATRGRVAFERGPVVYCVEDVDFAGSLGALAVPANVRLGVESRKLLGGLTVVTIEGATIRGA